MNVPFIKSDPHLYLLLYVYLLQENSSEMKPDFASPDLIEDDFQGVVSFGVAVISKVILPISDWIGLFALIGLNRYTQSSECMVCQS